MAKLSRRKFTREFKIKVCQEVELGKLNKAQICRKYDICYNTLARWSAEYEKEPKDCFASSPSEEGVTLDPTEKIKELEAALGREVMKNEILKEANLALKKRYREEQKN